MYEANNLNDFKSKLRSHEIQQGMTGAQDIKNETTDGKINAKCDGKLRCMNCRNKFHNDANRPDKDKGSKLFKYNFFGHQSTLCL